MGWAAAAAIGGSLISGFFGAKSAKSQAKAQAKQQRLSDLFQGYRDDVNRKRQLEDRLSAEKAFNQYGAFSKSKETFAPRVFTDPSTVNPVNPYDDPKKAAKPAASPRPLLVA